MPPPFDKREDTKEAIQGQYFLGPLHLASSPYFLLWSIFWWVNWKLKVMSLFILLKKKKYNKDKSKTKQKCLFWDIVIAIRNTGKRCYSYDAKLLWTNTCSNTTDLQSLLMLPGKGSCIHLHIPTIFLLAFLMK